MYVCTTLSLLDRYGFSWKVLCGILVALVAVLVGTLFTSLPERLGVYKYIDEYVDGQGNRPMMGFNPAIHRHTKFVFELGDISDLTGEVICILSLVTGVNSGLGRSSRYAFHLAGNGATVVLGCRTFAKAQAKMEEIRTAHPNAQLER